MGFSFKKLLKIVAIVAVVAAVAWFAAPYLGAFGTAIQSGMTAVGEAIAAGASAVGEALGLTATTAGSTATTAATTTAELMGTGAAAGEAAGSFAGSALAGGAEAGATLGTTTLSGAAETIGAADGLVNAGSGMQAASQMGGMGGVAGGANSVPGMTTVANSIGGAMPAVTQTGGMLSSVGAWVKDNPLVASTVLKGVGDFAGSLAGEDEAANANRAKMEYEEWQRQRLSESIMGGLSNSNLQYRDPRTMTPLRRADGTPVYTGRGGVPGGALQRVMPGYGG